MSKIETTMENELIESLTMGDSQWTYCPKLKTEKDLWNNLKSILESNNQDKLQGQPLTETEFKRVKNQIEQPSFYDAGVMLTGENGVVHVQIERNGRPVLLNLFNRFQKTGGSSVYQIINQYNAFKDEDTEDSQNRRYDLTFLFNGLPLIHCELKNGRHASYLEAFHQIQKYINEGHFKGIFSLVQMFIVSNGVNTKYIAANEDLKKEFLTSWTEEKNPDVPVAGLFDFSRKVLRIPEAHEMVTDYCQLDAKKRKVMLLRPYQIQAIQALRNAYMNRKPGYIWHATGSGKTLTSYKSARNLLLDIPNIDKTVFLIDRKDLDYKTCEDFDSYATSDTVDVEGTEDTTSLEMKLLSDKRQMIVTTVQKLQTLIRRYADNPDGKRIEKMKSKNVAFIVDECHRTVTLSTQVAIKGFFPNNLWYGFTGTPIFTENQGNLAATTQYMYGDELHAYTIKNALHDKSVLGFQVERLGQPNLTTDADGNNVNENLAFYDTEQHMLSVVDNMVNKAANKLGIENGPGRTYEALLTTGYIKRAQKYYDLFRKVKKGETSVVIDPDIAKRFDGFPKVAITYSIQENREDSEENNKKLSAAIGEYNEMFGTHFRIDDIDSYNADITKRFARKDDVYQSRKQQLDFVIVADRLLTGFDAPCLSTIYLDRQPMNSHKLIQALSRTNRLFDKNKTTGYVVTFQAPDSYKNAINHAIKLFSKGGTGEMVAPDFEEVEKTLIESTIKLRAIAGTPGECTKIQSDDRLKKMFCLAFQRVDSALSQIKGYIEWNNKDLEKDYGISKEELYAYEAWYNNFMEEDKGTGKGDDESVDGPTPDVDYELMSYGKETIDYLYIVRLIQDYVKNGNTTREDIEKSIELISSTSVRLGEALKSLWNDVLAKPEKYKDEDLIVLFEEMKDKTVEKALLEVADELCINPETVKYSAMRYNTIRDEIPAFDAIKESSSPQDYSYKIGRSINRLQYYQIIREKLKLVFDENVLPFRNIC